MASSELHNRLKKNLKQLRAWAVRGPHTAFRVYDKDLPQWPVAVDWYDQRVHVAEYFSRKQREPQQQAALRASLLEDIVNALEVSPAQVYFKSHQPHAWGDSQYQRTSQQQAVHTVLENGLRFEVNLSDYLDTGLFLDHRQTRVRMRGEVAGKHFLNLFAYTGSFTVYAAAGHAASTTSVDLSASYCQWARRNLQLNGFDDPRQHQVIESDVFAFLAQCKQRYALAVVDPPSFSASKKMQGRFEVQRDHVRLLDAVKGVLSPGGQIYFSTNYAPFQLDVKFESAKELTQTLLPKDFRQPMHRCWVLGQTQGARRKAGQVNDD
jgi:23S rRNA (cytosine1962-C5)-methyltransferase